MSKELDDQQKQLWTCLYCSFDANWAEQQACSYCSRKKANPKKRKLAELGQNTIHWAKSKFDLFTIGNWTTFDEEFFIYFSIHHRHSVRIFPDSFDH